jgi:phosphomevalonate kinase
VSGMHLKLRVPGKLMIAGEYAVLEPGQEAVVVAVDRYVTATISHAEENQLFLPGIGLPNLSFSWTHHQIHLPIEDCRLRYIQIALATVLGYLEDKGACIEPFHLLIESELDDPDGRKYGLGSSAAVVVAVVSSVLHWFCRTELVQDLIYRLSAVAHFGAQGSGSGADVAASVYGGWLRYVSFDSRWISARLASGMPVSKLVEEPWPNLQTDRIEPPESVQLCVGWTGEPAATAPLVQKVRAMKDRYRAMYDTFLLTSSEAVAKLVQSFAADDASLAIEAFELNRVALSRLGEQSGVSIETQKLHELHRLAKALGGAGKPSGAGGGDCGIALMIGEKTKIDQLFTAWKRSAIEPLPIHVCPLGAHVTYFSHS